MGELCLCLNGDEHDTTDTIEATTADTAIVYGKREWYSLDNGKGSICCTIRVVQLTEMSQFATSIGDSVVVSASFPKLPKIAAR